MRTRPPLATGGLSRGAVPLDDAALTAEITTPYVSYPDMITVECVDDGSYSYLQLTITTNDGPASTTSVGI